MARGQITSSPAVVLQEPPSSASAAGESGAPGATSPDGGHIYVVQSGETLGRILRDAGLNPRDAQIVAHLNGLSNANLIRAGQALTLPSQAEIDAARASLVAGAGPAAAAPGASGRAPAGGSGGRVGAAPAGISVGAGGVSLRGSGATRAHRAGSSSSPVLRRLEAKFAAWDTDHDGFLSSTELKHLEANPSIRGQDAAIVASLIHMYSQLEDASNDELGPENNGISLADLRARSKRAPLDGLVEAYRSQIDHTASAVFAPGGPDPEKASQGEIGDCYFVSACIALAKEDPAGLRKMIHDNGNGTYRVHIGGSDVTIKGPTDTELALYANAGSDGRWLSILEKAYAVKSNRDRWSILQYTRPQDTVDGGGFLSTGIHAMRGHSTDTDILELTSLATLRRKLNAAFKAHHLVTAGTNRQIPFIEDPRTSDGVTRGHAYAVLGYNAAKDTITLMNPWGYATVNEKNGIVRQGYDGVFTMPLKEFADQFSDIAYEQ